MVVALECVASCLAASLWDFVLCGDQRSCDHLDKVGHAELALCALTHAHTLTHLFSYVHTSQLASQHSYIHAAMHSDTRSHTCRCKNYSMDKVQHTYVTTWIHRSIYTRLYGNTLHAPEHLDTLPPLCGPCVPLCLSLWWRWWRIIYKSERLFDKRDLLISRFGEDQRIDAAIVYNQPLEASSAGSRDSESTPSHTPGQGKGNALPLSDGSNWR